MKLIGIIGLGFVGLTTALGFAEKNYRVYCYDKDLHRKQTIQSGNIPFHEQFLPELLTKHLNRNMCLCDNLTELIQQAHIVFYCVGTPSQANGKANLNSLVDAVCESLQIIKKSESGDIKTLVIKSTVPPSTTQETIQPILKKYGFQAGENIYLTNNPEFLREGFAWNDFIKPDRIIIGANDRKSSQKVKEAYQTFQAPIYEVSLNTAEFIKYLSNTLLADLISFANEMSIIADTIGGINISKAFQLLHMDKRWSGSPANISSYVYPGIGFGGYCLPKDTKALYTIAKENGYIPYLLKEVLMVNDKIKQHFITKIKKVAQKDDPICFLGLSFKPDSDDVRESPVKDIIKILMDEGYCNIIATDPKAIGNFKKTYQLPIRYIESIEEAVSNSKIVVLATAWKEYLEKKMLWANKQFIDGRYIVSLKTEN